MSFIKSFAILMLSILALHAQASADGQAAHQLKQMPELANISSDHFPGDPAEHKAVYMWNKSDPDYQHHILNSIQAMIRLYGSNVEIAVVAIGPGIHALAKKPQRKVEKLTYQRIASFAKDYGVRWIACGNTMKTLKWEDSDMRPFAEYSEVGAAALMALQENGYKLLVW